MQAVRNGVESRDHRADSGGDYSPEKTCSTRLISEPFTQELGVDYCRDLGDEGVGLGLARVDFHLYSADHLDHPVVHRQFYLDQLGKHAQHGAPSAMSKKKSNGNVTFQTAMVSQASP